MSVSFLSIQGVARDSPAPQLAPPLTRGVARRAELTSAQKASEHLAKGGGGGRERQGRRRGRSDSGRI